jgi:peptidoglycan/LPS O-acetylase OafA/YrhL
MVAALFAAAMSSPVLSALAETSLTMFHDGHRRGTLADADAVWLSRLLVAFWGVALGGFAIMLGGTDERLIPLAFAMTAYTYGSMLGLFLMALFIPKRYIRQPALGVAASIVGVLVIDNASVFGLVESGKLVAFPWLFPLGLGLCLGVALLPIGKRHDSEQRSAT